MIPSYAFPSENCINHLNSLLQNVDFRLMTLRYIVPFKVTLHTGYLIFYSDLSSYHLLTFDISDFMNKSHARHVGEGAASVWLLSRVAYTTSVERKLSPSSPRHNANLIC